MPLIIGGGPAGAAAAIILARGGRTPTVIERSAVPVDVLCGGFLSWTTLRLLHELDVDAIAFGAHPVRKLRIFAGERTAAINLPAPAAGLSRRRLDEALLARAAQAGAIIERGIMARVYESGTVQLTDGTGRAREHLILATGKHDLRGAARPVPVHNPALGLRWRFAASERLAGALGDAMELHLFPGGYAGLIMQEEGAANLCLAVRHDAFVEAGRNPDATLEALLEAGPHLAERLAGETMDKAQAVANIPYGWRARGDAGALYRVGDQLGVIPSLAGEGVGLALATGMAAADAVLAGRTPAAYQAQTSRRIARPIAIARALWHLAEQPRLARRVIPMLDRHPAPARLAMRLTRTS